MSKGHRRTQSSNLTFTPTDDFTDLVRKEIPVTSSEITVLLAKSNDKIREKVSSIETLNARTQQEDSLFQFGRVADKREADLRKRYMKEEYMMPIPEKKESFDMSEKTQNRQINSNPFSKKVRSGIGAIQIETRFPRQPFANTFNICSPVHVRRVMDWRDAQNRKESRHWKKADKQRI